MIGYAANPNFVLKNLTLSNVYIHVTAGLFAPDNSGGTGIEIRNTRAVNVHVYGAGCVSGFIEGPWGSAASILLENCSAIDGTAISTGGHSDGFTSCVEITGTATYNNCYTNIDVYGNTQTGVFVGVTHGGTRIFNNCYASGKIEGTDTIGGFFGCTSGAARETFTNCYSTSMVGMSNGGKNMGGFVGVGNASTTYAVNCYAAGEVGTLRSAPDGMPLDEGGNRLTGNNVTGFSGNNTGNFTNCYYDKQTTAMYEFGQISGRVTGVLTKDLIATNLGDQWVMSSGGYPELVVFSNSTDAYDRACSLASVSTVHLYASEDKTDYDTVRKIRYVFPLTSNANSGKASFDIHWENYVGEDPSNPLFPNVSPLVEGNVPIITLADVGTKDNVSSVAPGIGWLQVGSETDGVVGKRRLRLVPTTSIAISSSENAVMGVDHFIYTSPVEVPENYRALPDEEIYYDHRGDISFVTTDAYKLNEFILDGSSSLTLGEKLDKHKISSVPFPKSVDGKMMVDDEYVDDEGEILEYRFGADLNHDIIHIRISFQQEDGTLKELLWTQSLLDLITEKRAARPTTADDQGEEGIYVLAYEWLDSTGSLKAQSSKRLSVARPGTITYYWNDTTHTGKDSIYAYDPGAYRYAETITQSIAKTPTTFADEENTDVASLLKSPERKGYTFTGWKTSTDDLGAIFDENTAVIGDMKVYAQWKADEYTIKYETEDGEVVVENQETDTPIQLPEPKPTKEDYSLVGWTPDPDGQEPYPDLEEKTLLDILKDYPEILDDPDHKITLYPVWEKNPDPEVKVTVENKTHPEEKTEVGDELRYTVEVGNEEEHSRWVDVKIEELVPEGLTLLPEGIEIEYPDGHKEKVKIEEIYDEKTRTLKIPVGDIEGKESYKITIDVKVNEEAKDKKTGKKEDIGMSMSAIGKTPSGVGEVIVVSEKVTPEGWMGISTGDRTEIMSWMMMMGISVVGCLYLRRKEEL